MTIENLEKAKNLEKKVNKLEDVRSVIASIQEPIIFDREQRAAAPIPLPVWEEVRETILAEMLTLINECYKEIESL